MKGGRPGAGRFQWSAGGWFGSQLGGSLWLAITALVVRQEAPRVAAIASSAFLAANLVGTILWLGRSRLPPYPALQVLLLALGGAALVASLALRQAIANGAIEPRLGVRPLLVLALYLGLAVFFWALEASGRRGRGTGSARE